MANCLYLHDKDTTQFDFMNYAFAKLVVAGLLDPLCVLMSLPRRAMGSVFCNCGVSWSYLFQQNKLKHHIRKLKQRTCAYFLLLYMI